MALSAAAEPVDIDAAAGQCETVLQLSGLYCAACAGLIEAALGGVTGVVEARVNAESLRARVRWHRAQGGDAQAMAQALIAAVRGAGYEAAPDMPHAAAELRRAEARTALWRLFVAGFCAMQVMMLAAPGYFAEPGELAPDLRHLLDWGAWLLSLPVLLFAATPFFSGAWRATRHGRIGMELPVALGIGVTFLASSAVMFGAIAGLGDPAEPVYFDSLTMFVSFLLLGRWLELRLRHRAAQALEAASGALPERAWRQRADGDVESVALAALRVGDVLRVPLGQAFAADGVVLQGRSLADEALLSGESRPVAKAVGDTVVGGSVNVGAPLLMRVLRCGADTRHAAIARLMHDAQMQRPATAAWAQRWAAPFLWTVLALAALASAVWSQIEPARALWVGVSVLIVTCPCALALATPSALLATTQAMARRGLLWRRLEALETLASIDHVFIDKTGTLTGARPQFRGLQRWPLAAGPVAREFDEARLLALASSLAGWSQHPLAQALNTTAPAPVSAPAWQRLREQPGAGVEGRDADGRLWRLGSLPWVQAESTSQSVFAQSPTPVDLDPGDDGLATHFGCNGTVLARLNFDESLSAGAAAAIAALRGQGLAVTLLSGDSAPRVQRLAQRLGLAPDQAIAAASPEDKLRAVVAAQARGQRVAMIGDGLNDAPVLARADVSLAMGEGALLARASADAVITSNALGDVVLARRLAQRMLRVIRQNIAWAAAYNVLCVPLALLGYFPPWAAGLGMAASSLAVVANSLRLQR